MSAADSGKRTPHLILTLAQELLATQVVEAQALSNAGKQAALEGAQCRGGLFDGRCVHQLQLSGAGHRLLRVGCQPIRQQQATTPAHARVQLHLPGGPHHHELLVWV